MPHTPSSNHVAITRLFLLIGGLAFPMFGVVRAATSPERLESVPLRMVIGGGMVAIGLASYRSSWVADRLRGIGLLSIGSIQAFILVQASQSGFPGDLTAGIVVAFSIGVAVAVRTRQALAFSLTTLAVVPLFHTMSSEPDISLPILMMLLSITAVVMSVLKSLRLKAIEELQNAHDLLEERVAERTALLATEIEERRRAEATALEASSAKSLFLAKMSHELRTPLTTILGYADLLEAPLRSDETIQDLNHLRTAAHHLTALIDDVLDIARIETGGMDLTLEPFDPATIVREAVASIQEAADAKRLEVFSDLHNGELVYADRRRTVQILMNLLSNAVKFTEFGGIHIDVHPRGPLLVIHVQDTGCGISPEAQDQIFERFGTEPMSTGVGLGLSIAYELAQVMNGDLTVASESGCGSTFSLTLPRYTSRQTSIPPTTRVSIH